MAAATDAAAAGVESAYERIGAAGESGAAGLEAADAQVTAGAEAMVTATDSAAAGVEAAYEKIGTAAETGAAGLEAADAKVTSGAEAMVTATDSAAAGVEAAYEKIGTAAETGATGLEAADAKVSSSAEAMVTATDSAVAGVEAAYERMGAAAETGAAGLQAADAKVTAGAEGMVAGTDTAVAGVDAAYGKIGAAAGESATAVEAADAKVATASGEAATAAEAGAAKQAEAADTSVAKSAEAGDAADGMSSKMKTAFLGLGASVAVGVDQAMKFSGAMTQLNTQAGVSASQLGNLQGTFGTLGQGVLALAGQVGFSPDSLAESLFHVESNMASLGIKAPQALNMVKTAAEGAAVGHAKLVDVTNALTAAVASQIPGVQNINQAMGQLNATVGAGDMKMQDLADAMGTGMVAVVKGYGLSITDVGAALATFGDNNIRGAKAGTDLRMAVQALAVPVKSAGADLKEFGMNTNTLATDMQQHGLLYALNDLDTRMKANGVTAQTEGQVITDMFGKKAGAGVAVLLEQMDRLKSKYPDIQKSGADFANATATQQKTMEQKWKDLTNGLQALAIEFGTALLPAVTKLTGGLSSLINWFNQGSGAAKALAAVVGGTLLVILGGKLITSIEQGVQGFQKMGGAIVTLIEKLAGQTAATEAATVAQGELDVAMDANPIGAIIIIIVALVAAFVLLWTKCAWFRDLWKGMWNDVVGAAQLAWNLIQTGVTALVSFLTSAVQGLPQMFSTVWDTITSAAQAAWNAIVSFLSTTWNTITSGIQTAWNAITSFFSTFWSGLTSAFNTALNTIESALTTAWNTITSALKTAWDAITSFFSTFWSGLESAFNTALTTVESALSTAWDTITSALHTAWNAITSFFSTFWSGIQSAFDTALTTLENALSTAWNTITSAIQTAWNAIVAFFTSIPGQIVNAFSALPTDMENVGINAINGLLSGLESAAQTVINYVNQLATSIYNTIKSALGIASPSRKFSRDRRKHHRRSLRRYAVPGA